MASEQLFNLNLVKEIEKYPCLYNYKLIAYSLKDVTDKAWSDVGKTVNLSVSECKERWKNLRSVFIRHKKQAMNGTATRKPYYLEDAMEFIQPFVKSLKSPAGNISASFEVVYDDVKDEDTSSHQTVCRQSPELDPWGVVSPAASPLQNQPYQYYPSKKRPSEDKADLQDYLRAKIRKVQEHADPQKDANTLFLFSLLPDMNEMSAQQVRAFKRRVLDLIDEVLASNASPTTTVKIEPVYQYT